MKHTALRTITTILLLFPLTALASVLLFDGTMTAYGNGAYSGYSWLDDQYPGGTTNGSLSPNSFSHKKETYTIRWIENDSRNSIPAHDDDYVFITKKLPTPTGSRYVLVIENDGRGSDSYGEHELSLRRTVNSGTEDQRFL